MKTFYRGDLPHLQLVGATFFVTFRLYNSLPSVFLKKLRDQLDAKIIEVKSSKWLDMNKEIYKHQRWYFQQYDNALDKVINGVDYLKDKDVAQILGNRLHLYDGELYHLLAYCIMSNHVHILIDTSIQLKDGDDLDRTLGNYVQLDKIMGLIKGGSSYEINQILGRSGRLWQKESYDHYVRDGKELTRIIWYIVNNPVKARMVQNWTDFEFTYVAGGFSRLA